MTEKKESARTFDPVWEEIYGRREQLNRYPVDGVAMSPVSTAVRRRSNSAAPGSPKKNLMATFGLAILRNCRLRIVRSMSRSTALP